MVIYHGNVSVKNHHQNKSKMYKSDGSEKQKALKSEVNSDFLISSENLLMFLKGFVLSWRPVSLLPVSRIPMFP